MSMWEGMFSKSATPQQQMQRTMMMQQLGNLGSGLMQASGPVPWGQTRQGMFGQAMRQAMPDPRMQMMMMQQQQQAAQQQQQKLQNQQIAEAMGGGSVNQMAGQLSPAGQSAIGQPQNLQKAMQLAIGSGNYDAARLIQGQMKQGQKPPTGFRTNAQGEIEVIPAWRKYGLEKSRAGKTDITNVMPGAKTKIGKSVADRDALAKLYGEDHPAVQAIDREMASTGVDKTKAAEARKKMLNLDRGQGSLDRYQALLTKHGTELMPGAAQAELGSAHTDLMMELKELFNLGVLNGPDLDLMLKVVGDPTTLSAGIRSGMSQLMGTGDPFQAQLDLVRKKYDEAREKARATYQGKGIEPPTGPAAPAAADPLGLR